MSTMRAADSIPGGQRRSFLSTAPFASYFFSYSNTGSTSIPNWQLVQITYDDTKCPGGRVLRENGRKLYPGANANVTKYYVGVFDSKTFLNGFIDPNAKVFTDYNNDRPVYVDDACSDDGSEDCSYLGDFGEPVYTQGIIATFSGQGPDYTSEAFAFMDTNGDADALLVVAGSSNVGAEIFTNYDGNAQLEIAQIGEGYNSFVGHYATNPDISGYYAGGDMYYTGLLHPMNSAGQVVLSAGTYTVSNELFGLANAGLLVFLTRSVASYSGEGSIGDLTYTINSGDSTMTITSSSNTDESTVNWFVVSQSTTTPTTGGGFGPYARTGPRARGAPAPPKVWPPTYLAQYLKK